MREKMSPKIFDPVQVKKVTNALEFFFSLNNRMHRNSKKPHHYAYDRSSTELKTAKCLKQTENTEKLPEKYILKSLIIALFLLT